eukprot:gene28103-31211_t
MAPATSEHEKNSLHLSSLHEAGNAGRAMISEEKWVMAEGTPSLAWAVIGFCQGPDFPTPECFSLSQDFGSNDLALNPYFSKPLFQLFNLAPLPSHSSKVQLRIIMSGYEDNGSEARDGWDSLPLSLLTQIFEHLLRGSTPHPKYLPMKRAAWYDCSQVCKHWKYAMQESLVRLRGIEFHAPDKTQPSVYRLLSDPRLLQRSGGCVQSLVEAPYDGQWQPSDFPHCSQLVLRRALEHVSTSFDATCVAQLKVLSVLVLGGGFSTMSNAAALPISLNTLVINCPGNPKDSRLTFPDWPPGRFVEWLSLSSHALQISPLKIQGCFKQVSLHTALLLLDSPAMKEANKMPIQSREAIAEGELNLIADGIARDDVLMEFQLNCDSMLVGAQPEGGLNDIMLASETGEEVADNYITLRNDNVLRAFETAVHKVMDPDSEVQRAVGDSSAPGSTSTTFETAVHKVMDPDSELRPPIKSPTPTPTTVSTTVSQVLRAFETAVQKVMDPDSEVHVRLKQQWHKFMDPDFEVTPPISPPHPQTVSPSLRRLRQAVPKGMDPVQRFNVRLRQHAQVIWSLFRGSPPKATPTPPHTGLQVLRAFETAVHKVMDPDSEVQRAFETAVHKVMDPDSEVQRAFETAVHKVMDPDSEVQRAFETAVHKVQRAFETAVHKVMDPDSEVQRAFETAVHKVQRAFETAVHKVLRAFETAVHKVMDPDSEVQRAFETAVHKVMDPDSEVQRAFETAVHKVMDPDSEVALVAAYRNANKGATPHVPQLQLTVNHNGPEIELSLTRQREGDTGPVSLRLDGPGAGLGEALPQLLQQGAETLAKLQAAAAAKEAGGGNACSACLMPHSSSQQPLMMMMMGPSGMIAAPPFVYRAVSFRLWDP